MKVFIDTNVILENFLRREDYDVAHRLFDALQRQGHTLYISSGSFYSMVFLVDKYLKKELGIFGNDSFIDEILSNKLTTNSFCPPRLLI